MSAKKKPARAKGNEEMILLNIASGMGIVLGVKGTRADFEKALQSCIDKGWLKPAGRHPRYTLTQEGKEAAGLVLREVPLPKHLADLVKPGIKVNRG